MMTMFKTPDTRGKLLFNVPMTKYNTWGVGGNAQCVYLPADLDDLSTFLSGLEAGIPVTWLGLGSNVLIRDGGIDGVVIVTQSGLKQIQFEGKKVHAQAGVACAKLARSCVSKGLSGIEFMAGIPGTVGGALAMNAGAFGGQTWPKVEFVNVINRQGKIRTRAAKEYEYGYRNVKLFSDEWFVEACFALETEIDSENVISIKELLAQRSATQPIGKKNCGSVFMNPENEYAANLIEKCGLKGFSIGGACVSEKHANFILNENEASAHDIEELIKHVQATVNEKFNIELHTEVRFIGSKAEDEE